MIAPNELRIGNWVEGPMNYPVQILNGRQIDEYASVYSPIELAPEIVNQCSFLYGFEIKGEPGDYYYQTEERLPQRSLQSADGSWLTYLVHVMPITYHTKLNYVHQLQNLYYALKGIELTIYPLRHA